MLVLRPPENPASFAYAHAPTPGKTRLLNWFRVVRDGREVWLVDLPGYGYAKVAKAERAEWKRWIEAYLSNRPTLRLAVLLQDLRRDPSEDETLLLRWLTEREIPRSSR